MHDRCGASDLSVDNNLMTEHPDASRRFGTLGLRQSRGIFGVSAVCVFSGGRILPHPQLDRNSHPQHVVRAHYFTDQSSLKTAAVCVATALLSTRISNQRVEMKDAYRSTVIL